MGWFEAVFGGARGRRNYRYERLIGEINRLDPSLSGLTDGALQERGTWLRQQACGGATLSELLVPVFAVVREASRRVLAMRHFDVQLVGGMALHDGLIAEMKTGEGKTLAATLPVILNALSGRGVHVVTVNDYLASRDAEWMGPLYHFLGLSVGVVTEELGDDAADEYAPRRAAYASDITYVTNHELAFDYLRDNLATHKGEIVHRGFHFAIVDEVDFLLIDEARTPLIISGQADEDVGLYRRVNQIVRKLQRDDHYAVDPKTRTASLTDVGWDTVSRALGVPNLWTAEHLDLYHAVHQAVIAHGAYARDVDYVVADGEVLIVDEFTGRISPGKRYSDGLHQALEAKERLRVQAEDQTLAKVSYQTFFARYEKLAGMTGTAWSEREEFQGTYRRDVHVIPTNRPCIREDLPDVIYDTRAEKLDAVVEEIQLRRQTGQPVLVGTTSVRESEDLSRRLQLAAIPHTVLNAKNHRAEAAIIAQAGRERTVTISTNMAGRGIDIILGGESVREAGGLHVIGTGRHESVRIDNQLRGRAGRQGDPGSSQFFVSLDDEIWQKFGRQALLQLRRELRDGEARTAARVSGAPLTAPKVRRLLRELQKKVDVENVATRKEVLKYDLVLHVQREAIYRWRNTLLADGGFVPDTLIGGAVEALYDAAADDGGFILGLSQLLHAPVELAGHPAADLFEAAKRYAAEQLREREQRLGAEDVREVGRQILLQSIDTLWTDHLSNLERVEEGVDLHAYSGMDPLIEWQKMAAAMWVDTLRQIHQRALSMWFLVTRAESVAP